MFHMRNQLFSKSELPWFPSQTFKFLSCKRRIGLKSSVELVNRSQVRMQTLPRFCRNITVVIPLKCQDACGSNGIWHTIPLSYCQNTAFVIEASDWPNDPSGADIDQKYRSLRGSSLRENIYSNSSSIHGEEPRCRRVLKICLWLVNNGVPLQFIIGSIIHLAES